ncbi:hypothetical protein OMP38_26635 [Cohnella ginsengisoli]|uniref:Uncharacterized protein n=1 Tax=Cohnella ginsengisoli TaxID=425004 RepID=A0A9X4QQQ9_9BACL|nr:hypothetical protein [Cohnella ginsengisoli]MDG0794000.1 hypothetical protein [Cohnella ginsengisoli]
MYLKEFDLDLPYMENDKKIRMIMNEEKCQYNEATKLDYEMNWKEIRRQFRLETRCITAMYERLFSKIKIKGCWKILVECVEDITDERVRQYSGVCSVQVKFNFNDFSNNSEVGKKETTLNLLMEGIEKISQENNWEMQKFREIGLQIEEARYLNEWLWKKAIKKPR